MAINYTNLFGDIVSVISAIEEIEAMMVTIEARRSSMITTFQASGVTNLINNVNQAFDALIQRMEQNISDLITLADSRLKDRETVVEELPAMTAITTDSVITNLIADMITNSQTVKKSSITVTANPPVTENTDVGTLIVTKKLPGNIRSGLAFRENRFMAGVESELTLSDEIRIKCTSDSQTDSAEGRESFVATGTLPEQQSPFAANQGGNKGTQTINVSDNNTLITNFFEDFDSTTGIPEGWTTTGVSGTDFEESTSEFLFGASSLALKADQDINSIDYDITNLVVPGQVMCLYLYIKRQNSGVSGSVSVGHVFNGVTTNSFFAMSATYDDFSLETIIFDVPKNIGDEAKISILNSSGTGGDIYLDGGGLIQMEQYAGLGLGIIRGEDKFLIDDTFSLTVTNNDAGKIQRFFTRAFGYQLPSDTVGTIPEPV